MSNLVRKPKVPRGNPDGADAVPSPQDTSFVTDEFLPYLVTQTSNLWNLNFKRDLARTPVNVRQWRVLSSLSRKSAQSLKELAEATAIDQPTMSRMIDQLIALGLVARQAGETDARYVKLSLTRKGEKLRETVWPVAWQHYRLGVASLSPAEERTLVGLLQRVLLDLRDARTQRGRARKPDRS